MSKGGIRPIYRLVIMWNYETKSYDVSVFQCSEEKDRFTIIQTLERERFKILNLKELEDTIKNADECEK